MDLFDEIQERMNRQQNMMAKFQNKPGSVDFAKVNLEKTKAKPDKDKGKIIPSINYIDDEVEDATTR